EVGGRGDRDRDHGPVVPPGRQRNSGDRDGREGEQTEHVPHGANRYPTLRTVWMWVGLAGSSSIFSRSQRTWTSTVRVSPMNVMPHTSSRICVRVSACPGWRMKY